MIDAIQSLLRLQEIDLELHVAREELAEFPPRRAKASAARAQEGAAIAAAEARIAEEEREHRGLEIELRDVEALLEKLNNQLYEVTSKQALDALQGELDRAGAHRSEKEDRILELLESIDEANAVLETARQAARDGEAAGVAEEAVWTQREAELEAEIERLLAVRAERAEGLDAPTVRAYDGARRKRLPAVIFVGEKTCPVCRMTISPQKWIDIVSATSLVHCGSCDRIFFGDKVAEAERAGAEPA